MFYERLFKYRLLIEETKKVTVEDEKSYLLPIKKDVKPHPEKKGSYSLVK